MRRAACAVPWCAAATLLLLHVAWADDDLEVAVSKLKSANARARAAGEKTLLRAGSKASTYLLKVVRSKAEEKSFRRRAATIYWQIRLPWAVAGAEALIDTASALPTRVVHKASGIAMALIPSRERGRDGSKLLRAFYLGQHEVTLGAWARVLGHDLGPLARSSADLPVTYVTRAQLERFLKTTQLRLPTEEEWWHACWGGRVEGRKLDEIAWYAPNTDIRQRVGQKKPNRFGIYDMLGNVWEWCAPKKPGQEKWPVRGGGFQSGSDWLRPSARATLSGSYLNKDLGFRVARSP